MVRNYVRTTDRALIDEDAIAKAVKEVLKGGSFRKVAEKYALKKSMLHKRVKIAKSNMTELQTLNNDDSGNSEDDQNYITTKNIGGNKYQIRKVFSDEDEKLLADYFVKASNLHYGLTYKQSRELAFQYAKALNKKSYPTSWNDKKMAGEDWILGFMKRHPTLSCRRPENTSLARDAAFNATNVSNFFDNYVQLLDKYKFTPDRIINLDETGIPTVMQHPKVIALKGKKQVGAVSSQERGENVTMCGIISAAGVAVPPLFIFPRVNRKKQFLDGAPTGSVGLFHKSGYMTSDLFLEVLAHIKTYFGCSAERRLLILMDNHSSHVSLQAINYAREAGISLLSFPPHCSHRLQPLDVAVFGPLKGFMKVAMADWMRVHPGRPITIADIAGLCGKAYLLAFTPKNILSGFSAPGIWPLNRLALGEESFLPSEVTDRPPPPANAVEQREQPGPSMQEDQPAGPSSVENNLEEQHLEGHVTPPPLYETSPSAEKLQISHKLTPQDCWPLQKAKRPANKQRARKKSIIYTSTPVKNQLEEEQAKKTIKKPLRKQVKKAKIDKSDSDTDQDISLYSEDEGWCEDEEESSNLFDQITDDQEVAIGSFILVRFATKKTFKYYVGQVEQAFGKSEFMVNYLRKKGKKFQFPDVSDSSSVERKDIVRLLPAPMASVTERQGRLFHFSINLDGYNVY